MYRGQQDDLNIRASFWHVMNAFLGSLAVIIAASFIAVAQIYEADTWAGMVFALVLLWAAYGIVRDALRVLIDATPSDTDLVAVSAALSAIPGVRSTHHVHSRVVTGKLRTFSGHLVIDETGDPIAILQQAKELLDTTYGFSLSTIQIEAAGLTEANPGAIEYQHRQHEKPGRPG